VGNTSLLQQNLSKKDDSIPTGTDLFSEPNIPSETKEEDKEKTPKEDSHTVLINQITELLLKYNIPVDRPVYKRERKKQPPLTFLPKKDDRKVRLIIDKVDKKMYLLTPRLYPEAEELCWAYLSVLSSSMDMTPIYQVEENELANFKIDNYPKSGAVKDLFADLISLVTKPNTTVKTECCRNLLSHIREVYENYIRSGKISFLTQNLRVVFNTNEATHVTQKIGHSIIWDIICEILVRYLFTKVGKSMLSNNMVKNGIHYETKKNFYKVHNPASEARYVTEDNNDVKEILLNTGKELTYFRSKIQKGYMCFYPEVIKASNVYNSKIPVDVFKVLKKRKDFLGKYKSLRSEPWRCYESWELFHPKLLPMVMNRIRLSTAILLIKSYYKQQDNKIIRQELDYSRYQIKTHEDLKFEGIIGQYFADEAKDSNTSILKDIKYEKTYSVLPTEKVESVIQTEIPIKENALPPNIRKKNDITVFSQRPNARKKGQKE
jgi:hypothetical protein